MSLCVLEDVTVWSPWPGICYEKRGHQSSASCVLNERQAARVGKMLVLRFRFVSSYISILLKANMISRHTKIIRHTSWKWRNIEAILFPWQPQPFLNLFVYILAFRFYICLYSYSFFMSCKNNDSRVSTDVATSFRGFGWMISEF